MTTTRSLTLPIDVLRRFPEDRRAAGQGVGQPVRRVAYGSLNSEYGCLKLVGAFRSTHS